MGFRYLYVGQYGAAWDDVFDLGLHLMGVRHYSPALGRFVQPDPAALEANAYAYSDNTPVTKIDPAGEAATCTLAGFSFWIPFIGQVALGICAGSLVILGGIVVISGLTVIANNILWKEADAPSRLNEEVRRGQAPRSVTSVHNPHVPGDKPHVHFRDGYSRNQDGSRRHGTARPLTRNERDWLSRHGWK